MTITIVLLIAIVGISIYAFSNYEVFSRLKFNSPAVVERKEYFRLITHSFVHSDYTHLFVNAFVLYSFGRALEYYYLQTFEGGAKTMYLVTYFGGVVVSCLPGLLKKRVYQNYSAVGASGGVSAVLFATILFNPMNKIYFYAVLPIPGIVFGLLYLGYSYYMIERSEDNVAHDAHFIGSVFGFLFPVAMKPVLLLQFFDRLF